VLFPILSYFIDFIMVIYLLLNSYLFSIIFNLFFSNSFELLIFKFYASLFASLFDIDVLEFIDFNFTTLYIF
jgi:hypothetical protein